MAQVVSVVVEMVEGITMSRLSRTDGTLLARGRRYCRTQVVVAEAAVGIPMAASGAGGSGIVIIRYLI